MRTVADYHRAKTLYDVDRYSECMDLIDRVMGIPHDANFEDISNTLRRDWKIDVEPSQFNNDYIAREQSHTLFSSERNDTADMRCYGVFGLIDLMNLRSRCLSAIFFSSDADLKERYQKSVLLNVYIIFELIPLELPGAPDVWRFAAQSLLLFEGHTSQAIDMIVDAIRALDHDRPAERELNMASSKDFAPERNLLATVIPRVVAANDCGDDVKRRVAELQGLVDRVAERGLVDPKVIKPKCGFGGWSLVASAVAMVAIVIIVGLSALSANSNSTFEKLSRELEAPPR